MMERRKTTIFGRLVALSAMVLASGVGDIDSSHGFGSAEEPDGLPVPRHARKAKVNNMLRKAEQKLAEAADEANTP